jgi:hypothetical protein
MAPAVFMGPRFRGDDRSQWYRMTKLYHLAHCRAGDKGNTTILSLIAYRREDFPLLRDTVTVDAVKRHLAGIVRGELTRYELPQLSALQFVGRDALCGGVTTSLALDAHGKSLSSALLEMEIEADTGRG